MKLLISAILNVFLTSIWSLIIILLWYGLLSDIDETDTYWMILGVAVVNAFITVMIHLIVFLPGYLFQTYRNEASSLSESFQAIYPGLLLPLVFYFGPITLILQAQELTQEIMIMVAFIAMGFMLVHSLSLYIFLFNITPSKTNSDEKIIESTL